MVLFHGAGGGYVTSWFVSFENCEYFISAVNKNDQAGIARVPRGDMLPQEGVGEGVYAQNNSTLCYLELSPISKSELPS
jgi:hypothetical protein